MSFQSHRRNKMCFENQGDASFPVQKMNGLEHPYALIINVKWHAKIIHFYIFGFATHCLYEKLVNWKATPARHKHEGKWMFQKCIEIPFLDFTIIIELRNKS